MTTTAAKEPSVPAHDQRPGAPCWIDLATPDIDATKRFYAELMGWEAQPGDPAFGGYSMWTREGDPVAGCMTAFGGAGGWTVYLATPDIDASLASLSAAGGSVALPTMPVGDIGTMAVGVDPGGARIGLWQAGTFAGFAAVRAVGAPGWFELQSPAYDAATAFYRDVFAMEPHVLGDGVAFSYTQLSVGGEPVAGIAGNPAGQGWQVVLTVADTRAALARAEALGGRVVGEAHDTEFGTLGELADPHGARFGLVSPNEAMPA